MRWLLILLPALTLGCPSKLETPRQRMSQFPSPMDERIRTHQRIEPEAVRGESFTLKDILPKPVDIYVASGLQQSGPIDVLIHFHGSPYVPQNAADCLQRPFIVAVVNLGSGSTVYENAFLEPSTFTRLVEAILDAVSRKASMEIQTSHLYLSSFSAGYGAVRAILRYHLSALDGIVLLDGLHTDYVPSGRVLAQGGELNEKKLDAFERYARLALKGQKKLVVTHSEIFPGTYASTTETADYLIDTLGLRRHPVLRWGPVGMQLLTETQSGGLTILGFAGNTAPDHIDHFHGLPVFLMMLLER